MFKRMVVATAVIVAISNQATAQSASEIMELCIERSYVGVPGATLQVFPERIRLTGAEALSFRVSVPRDVKPDERQRVGDDILRCLTDNGFYKSELDEYFPNNLSFAALDGTRYVIARSPEWMKAAGDVFTMRFLVGKSRYRN